MSSNIQFANYFSTSLAAPLAAAATSMLVTSAVGLPAIIGGQYFYLTLVDLASYSGNVSPPAQVEVVKVTAVAGTTLTIVRGLDGTTAQNFAIGDVVQNRINAATLYDIVGNAADIFLSGSLMFDGIAQRVYANMSDASLGNRLLFVSSIVNGSTTFGIAPNGAGAASGVVCFESSNIANAGYGLFLALGGVFAITSGASGSGTPPGVQIQFNGTTVASAPDATQFQAVKTFVTLAAIAQQGYSRQTPATGFAITIGNAISMLILDPAGALASGTITMPAAPSDGQIVHFSSTQAITALTVSANAGQTLKNPITTLAAGGVAAWIYNLALTTWYRYQ